MDEYRARWTISAMCRVFALTRQGYYAWKHSQPSERSVRRERVGARICSLYEQSYGSYSSPRLTQILRKESHCISRKTVAALMRMLGLTATRKRRFRPTTDSRGTLAPAPNLLQRAFRVQQPDRVWVSDFTELPCRNGKAYAVAIMDLCSRRILGITVSRTPCKHKRCLRLFKMPAQHDESFLSNLLFSTLIREANTMQKCSELHLSNTTSAKA